MAVVILTLVGYVVLDGLRWLLVVLVLAPDRSMPRYLGENRRGDLNYDFVHTYTVASQPVLTGSLVTISSPTPDSGRHIVPHNPTLPSPSSGWTYDITYWRA